MRVSFTAASPLSELVKHKVIGMDWPHNEPAADRRPRLAAAMPPGWTLDGAAGWTWIHQGRQRYRDGKAIEWVKLLERYVRSYNQRYHDTSAYVYGAGLIKRITITGERGKTWGGSTQTPGPGGTWSTWGLPAAGASGIAVLPASAVSRSMDWEKTPDDIVTDVQASTYGVWDEAALESYESEFGMSYDADNCAAGDHGFRQFDLETAISLYNMPAFTSWITNDIVPFWLDTQTAWRPTSLQIPDSRELDTAPLLNLLAVDTRPMSVVNVPPRPISCPA